MRYLAVISLTCLAFFPGSLCHGQVTNIDSLRKALPTLRDTAREDCLHDLGVAYLFKGGRDSTIYFANLVYNESKRINYQHGSAMACVLKAAIANHFYNDFSQMEKWAGEALSWFDQTSNKKNLGIAYWQLSLSQCRQARYDEALLNAKTCYDLANKTNDQHFKFSALESMTDIYRETGEYDKMFDAQDEMAQDERRYGDTSEYTFHQLWVMGLMYRLLEEYSTALPFWRQLFIERAGGFLWSWNQMEYAELMTQANQLDSALYYYNQFDSAKAEPKDLRYFLISKGEYLVYLKKYSTALPYFLKGLIYHRQLSDAMQVKRALLDIAKTYLALQNSDSAISYARQGLTMALAAKSKPAIRDGYQILSAVYDHLGRSDSANFYFRKFISAKDSVLNDQTKGRFAAYSYRQKIAALDKQKLLERQQLQKEKTNRNILIAALIIGLVLAGFVIRNIRLKRRKDQLQHLMTEANTQLENRRKEQQLAEIQQQKTELEMQALRAQMNPHFIFNSLNSINMFVLENNKLQASEYLSKFSRLVRLILQNSQEAFIPLERELEALQLYLELESLRFENKFVYRISVADNVDTTVLKVPPLVIQPYAENAIWHGLMHKKEKGHLEIELYHQENVLMCRITDDGVGRTGAEQLKSKFPAKHKSMGIKITESRIAMTQVNGSAKSVEIRDLVYPGGGAAGTEVILTIPTNSAVT